MRARAAPIPSQPSRRTQQSAIHFLARSALLATLGFWGFSPTAAAADLDQANQLFWAGRYDECARIVNEEIRNDPRGEPWHHLKIKLDLTRGEDPDALASLEAALRHFPASLPL